MITDGERDVATQISVAKRKSEKEGRREGKEEGLEALVQSLKEYLPDFNQLYAAVIKNKAYADVTENQVRKYF